MTNIVERVKSVFTGRKAAPAPNLIFWPQWREGQPEWQMTDLSRYIKDGYERNAVIYAAVMFKVRAAYSAVLRAYEARATSRYCWTTGTS